MNLNLELYLPVVYRLQKDFEWLETSINTTGEKDDEEKELNRNVMKDIEDEMKNIRTMQEILRSQQFATGKLFNNDTMMKIDNQTKNI